MSLKWTDSRDIAIELVEKHPDVDPLTVRFTDLRDWVMGLDEFDDDPDHSSEQTKARKPLAAAEVVVKDVEGNPGYYSSTFHLRPHYQLEGLTVSLRLVSTLPSQRG